MRTPSLHTLKLQVSFKERDLIEKCRHSPTNKYSPTAYLRVALNSLDDPRSNNPLFELAKDIQRLRNEIECREYINFPVMEGWTAHN